MTFHALHGFNQGRAHNLLGHNSTLRRRKVIGLDFDGVQTIGNLGLADVGCCLSKAVLKIPDDFVRNLWARLLQAFHLVAHHLEDVVRVHALIAGQRKLNENGTMDLGLLEIDHPVSLGPLGPSKLGADGIEEPDAQTECAHANPKIVRVNWHRLAHAGYKPIHSG